jgi:uncharacterized protein (DUF934 family)
MNVIDRDNAIVEDGWQLVADDADLPAGDIIVSIERWRSESDALKGRDGKLGVLLTGDTPLSDVAGDLDCFAMIALAFPKFSDGRCFSHARLLRERHDYQGELRAVGDVLRDQLFHMRRCGIDSFAVREDREMEDALNAFQEFTVRYQSAADGAEPIYRYR